MKIITIGFSPLNFTLIFFGAVSLGAALGFFIRGLFGGKK
jgi:hypothetical protein